MKLELDLSVQDALASLDALEEIGGSESLISGGKARNTFEALRVLRDAFRQHAGSIRLAAKTDSVELELLFP